MEKVHHGGSSLHVMMHKEQGEILVKWSGTSRLSCVALVLCPTGPTSHWLYVPLILLSIGPTSHWSFARWSYVPLVLLILPIGHYIPLVLRPSDQSILNKSIDSLYCPDFCAWPSFSVFHVQHFFSKEISL